MNLRLHPSILLFTGIICTYATASDSDPRVESWFTQLSGQYARVYLTDADRLAGNAVSTWSRGSLNQSLPAYCGVYEVASSQDWIYVRTTGLGSHTMGPWYMNAARSQLFINVPRSSATLYRIPRVSSAPTIKTLTGLGPIGVFVDGVMMFDTRDGFSVSASNGTEANSGLGIWNRDAYVNEGVTFDPANAHQPGSGQYHYHANAVALRALLNDNVGLDPVTKLYQETTTNTKLAHSPILGWVRDGFPIYGPYGYANATNSASGVRRMISGYVPRDLSDSAVANRTTLPGWAGRAQGRSTSLSAAQYGPPVSSSRPFGRYMEDNDYLGDRGQVLGTHFDLDEFNGRFCVTPEFPGGTYAYFTAITSNGTPAFPYNIGRQFYGNPTGGAVQRGTYPEIVTTNFVGGANSRFQVENPVRSAASDITLTWSSVEGGTYVVSFSTNLQTWATSKLPAITATGIVTRVTEPADAPNSNQRFHRVTRTSLAPYSN